GGADGITGRHVVADGGDAAVVCGLWIAEVDVGSESRARRGVDRDGGRAGDRRRFVVHDGNGLLAGGGVAVKVGDGPSHDRGAERELGRRIVADGGDGTVVGCVG